MAKEPLNDESIMYWGKKFSGLKMINVPASFLLWMKDKIKPDAHTQPIFDYIEDNLNVLQKQAKEESYQHFNN